MCLSAFNVFLYALFVTFLEWTLFSHFKLTYFLPIARIFVSCF